MSRKILIVDDDKIFLDSIRRSLIHQYDIDTAIGPLNGFKALQSKGQYAVIISDLAMPGMDGVQFLTKITDLSPSSIRVMMTGHGGFEAVIDAVNNGHVYQFIVKPCSTERIIKYIDEALEQYKRIMAEKELLRGTLRGSIKVLIDILNLVNPDAFNRGERIKSLMMAIVKRLQLSNTFKYELVGMLSQIGMVAVPQGILEKHLHGENLTPEETQIYRMHATVSSTLLSQIPRLNEVVEVVGSQLDCNPDIAPSTLSETAAIFNICLEYDDLEVKGMSKESIIKLFREKWGKPFPKLFKYFEELTFSDEGYIPRSLPLKHIVPGMVLKQDIVDSRNLLIMANGQEFTEASMLRLTELKHNLILPDSIDVLVPMQN